MKDELKQHHETTLREKQIDNHFDKIQLQPKFSDSIFRCFIFTSPTASFYTHDLWKFMCNSPFISSFFYSHAGKRDSTSVRKNIRNPHLICSHCNKSGHIKSNCSVLSGPPLCAICGDPLNTASHPPKGDKCPMNNKVPCRLCADHPDEKSNHNSLYCKKYRLSSQKTIGYADPIQQSRLINETKPKSNPSSSSPLPSSLPHSSDSNNSPPFLGSASSARSMQIL